MPKFLSWMLLTSIVGASIVTGSISPPINSSIFSLALFEKVAEASEPIGQPNCDLLPKYVNNRIDSAPALQNCLDRSPDGSTVDLPLGTYWVGSPISIQRRMTLKTIGKSFSDPACDWSRPDCAVIKALPSMTSMERAGDEFFKNGFFRIYDSATADHLAIDGNREERRQTRAGTECREGRNALGMNVRIEGSNATLSNSVSRHALCGTGVLVYGNFSGVRILRNKVVRNGTHSETKMWADGVTIHAVNYGLIFEDNIVRDNTDVNLISSSCHNCSFRRNEISHSDKWDFRSFAGIMLYSWGGTPSSYPGTVFQGNTVDCGPNKACIYGVQMGSRPWSGSSPVHTDVTFLGNTIQNARVGVNIEAMTNVRFHHNGIYNSGGLRDNFVGDVHPRCPQNFPAFNTFNSPDIQIIGGNVRGRDIGHSSFVGCLRI